MLRSCAQEAEDWPNQLAPIFACFEENFGSTVRTEIGEEQWDRLLIRWRDHLEYPDNDSAKKKPAVVENIIREAADGGARSQSLSAIIANIQNLAA